MKKVITITQTHTIEVDSTDEVDLDVVRQMYEAGEFTLSEPEFEINYTYETGKTRYKPDGSNRLYCVILIDDTCKTNIPPTLLGLKYFRVKKDGLIQI